MEVFLVDLPGREINYESNLWINQQRNHENECFMIIKRNTVITGMVSKGHFSYF